MNDDLMHSSSAAVRNSSMGKERGGSKTCRVELGYESQRSVMHDSFWAAKFALTSYVPGTSMHVVSLGLRASLSIGAIVRSPIASVDAFAC